MDRREVLRREIAANAYWGIGRTGCHDIPAPQQYVGIAVEGDPRYVATVDLETGEMTVESGQAEGDLPEQAPEQ
jgi:hypothetical protein